MAGRAQGLLDLALGLIRAFPDSHSVIEVLPFDRAVHLRPEAGFASEVELTVVASDGEARITAPMKPMITPIALFQVAFSPPRQSWLTITVVIGVMPLITPMMPLAMSLAASGKRMNGMA